MNKCSNQMNNYILQMNNYILCYKTNKGNRPCKTPLGEYITGFDVEDVNIKSTEYWEYLLTTYKKENLIILKINKK